MQIFALYLYSFTLFVSALLVFSVQPIVAKMVLPKLGGTPAVWNTCMLFFQGALLLGYAYAHWTTKVLSARRQLVAHLLVVLLPLLVLPVSVMAGNGPGPGRNPNLWLLTQLALVIGLPFFVLSTSAPLLQKWFAHTDQEMSRDPYFLYAASNAGSLLALLSYPFVIEPHTALVAQTRLWSGSYLAFLVLIGGCALAVWRTLGQEAHSASDNSIDEPGGDVTYRRRALWLFLSFVPSSLLLGVTTHITTDIAPMPLLWVVPLALYLLAFMLAFARRPLLPYRRMRMPLIYALPCLLPFFVIARQPLLAVVIHLAVFFMICMTFLGALADRRPATAHLTDFYLWISVGGMLGGVFNSLVAPAIFRSVAEYPLVLAASAFVLVPGGARPLRRDWYLLSGLLVVVVVGFCVLRLLSIGNILIYLVATFAIPVLLCFALRKRPLPFALGMAALFVASFAAQQTSGLARSKPLYAGRNFFGVKRVLADPARSLHILVHGSTIHGCQKMEPPEAEPLAYYSRSGPVGDILAAVPFSHVAVVGLGTGALASYVSPGQRITFYEIDPQVIALAQDPQLFTYLRDCRGTYAIVPGDARIELTKAPDGQDDVIVLDAFSSDFVPTHLLTREAAQLYTRKLRPQGVLLYHISSRYLDFAPMVAKLAEEMGMVCFSRWDRSLDQAALDAGKTPAHYLAVARPGVLPESITQESTWSQVTPPPETTPWRDDYSNLLAVLRR